MVSLDSLLMECLTNWLNLSVNCLSPSASPSLLNWLLFCYYPFSRAEPSASSNRWARRTHVCLSTSVLRSAYSTFTCICNLHWHSCVCFFMNMLLNHRICDIKRWDFSVALHFLFPLHISKKADGTAVSKKGKEEKRKELQKEERDRYHSSAVHQCMNRAGYSIILTLPLIYLIISLSMCIIMVNVAPCDE